MLAVIEGPDYSGKTSIIKQLSNDYDNVIPLRCPGGSSYIGDLIRFIIKDKSFNIPNDSINILSLVDWLITINEHNVYEMTYSNKWYVSDRNSLISDLVYKRLDGGNVKYLEKLYSFVYDAFDYPIISQLIIFNVDPQNIINRKQSRPNKAEDKWDNKDFEYYERMTKLYGGLEEYIRSSSLFTKFVKNISYVDANENIDQVLSNVEEILIKIN